MRIPMSKFSEEALARARVLFVLFAAGNVVTVVLCALGGNTVATIWASINVAVSLVVVIVAQVELSRRRRQHTRPGYSQEDVPAR